MVELPLVVIDVQRAGPWTGMPTKTEQADLLQCMFGRNGESPVADRRAGDARRLLRHGDRGVAHRAQVPDPGHLPVGRLPRQRRRAVAGPVARRACRTSRSRTRPTNGDVPAVRARPGDAGATVGHARARPGLEHRIGGLEKADITGNVSYDPANHDKMTLLRAAEDRRHRATTSRRSRSYGTDGGDLLVLGWGTTYGAIRSAVERLQAEGKSRRARAPALPQPVPAQHRRRPDALRQGADPGDQPRPAADAAPGQVPVDAVGYNRVRGKPFRSARSSTRPSASSATEHDA